MPRAADSRRGQAAVEWIALLAAVGVALGAGALAMGALPARIAARLDPPAPGRATAALTAAVRGDARAPSLLGAAAWLAEDVGDDDARRAVAAAVRRVVALDHPAWSRPLLLHGSAIRGRRTQAMIRAFGAVEVRVVSEDDERRAAIGGPTALGRMLDGGRELAWAGVQSLARRIARPLGIAVAIAQLALGLRAADVALAPGARAGDAVVCRRAEAVVSGGSMPRTRRIDGLWRGAVLRDGRLIADAVRGGTSPCRAPAAD